MVLSLSLLIELLGFPFLSVCQAGAQVSDPVLQVFNGQEVEVWPRIAWKPKWGLTFAEIKRKVCGSCAISQRSTMAIKGRNIFLEDLSLDGALLIDAIEDAEVSQDKLIDANCDVATFSVFFRFFFLDSLKLYALLLLLPCEHKSISMCLVKVLKKLSF